ncbi:unnamed protein product [Rotaria sp. Silwood2]|nr:unnamed protein product [Rotaria sp. Silwood2]CAF4063549.1 unnamed protein product [Rotaria sp. Silwood2]
MPPHCTNNASSIACEFQAPSPRLDTLTGEKYYTSEDPFKLTPKQYEEWIYSKNTEHVNERSPSPSPLQQLPQHQIPPQYATILPSTVTDGIALLEGLVENSTFSMADVERINALASRVNAAAAGLASAGGGGSARLGPASASAAGGGSVDLGPASASAAGGGSADLGPASASPPPSS